MGRDIISKWMRLILETKNKSCCVNRFKMPPKMKISSRSHHGEGSLANSCTNPRVVLRPLKEQTNQTCFRFTTVPPVASLFKRQEYSDIKLQVGDDLYYAHKLILCSASQVFAKMLSGFWADGKKDVLALEEEDECVKVFEKFLKYVYTGSAIISDSYVIPLFMLADKYDVQELYDECVKVIENGLKVYPVKKQSVRAMSVQEENNESSTSGSDSSEPEFPDCLTEGDPVPLNASSSDDPVQHSNSVQPRIHLVGSDTFPLSMVIKLLSICANEHIVKALLYNLEARLSQQLYQENYGVWNDLDQCLVLQMLKDDHFYCDEFVLFNAAKTWLEYDEIRQGASTRATVLSQIRYPVMAAAQLYQVENDPVIKQCPEAKEIVLQAMRFNLFRAYTRHQDESTWLGSLFQSRKLKDK